MKKLSILFFLGFIIILFILYDISTKKVSKIDKNPSSNLYLSKYAGGYTIEVADFPSKEVIEVYILHESGKAKWMWIENDGYGNASVTSEKIGKWSAELNKISISIQGKTDTIVENYVYKNGRFVNTVFSDRSLKRTK